MKAVDLWKIEDGRWMARIFDQEFCGTFDECVRWLRSNGEYAP